MFFSLVPKSSIFNPLHQTTSLCSLLLIVLSLIKMFQKVLCHLSIILALPTMCISFIPFKLSYRIKQKYFKIKKLQTIDFSKVKNGNIFSAKDNQS